MPTRVSVRIRGELKERVGWMDIVFVPASLMLWECIFMVMSSLQYRFLIPFDCNWALLTQL